MCFDPVPFRHALHQVPELAFEEHLTQKLLLDQIAELIAHSPAKARFEQLLFEDMTGILLFYRGGEEGDSYHLFRADMDALPMHENTGAEFASKIDGAMHACGHDIHMAVLMGLIARVAKEAPRQNAVFLFQPAEEGAGGAKRIIDKGILQKHPIASAYALHSGSGLEVGQISAKAGIFFGIPQEFDLRFIGKSAHVAFPEKGVNALSCAADFLVEMRTRAEKLSEKERLIFHVGKITGGVVRNSIADSCLLEGTHRTLSAKMSSELSALIREVAGEVAAKYSARFELDLLGSYDAVVNHPALYERLKASCAKLGYQFLEAETVMTGEDFGFFSGMYPSLLFWLGSGCEHSLHSDRYLPMDESIGVGIELFWDLLNSG